ncbi:MAG: amino acid ABC transporter permease [Desulfobacteraceae bacterium]|nr:amino acid ABC transporter permease [Desulfobacteraceae bacterium]
MDGFQFAIITDSLPELMEGARITLNITIVSYGIALLIGITTGIIRSGKGAAKFFLDAYVEIFRGVPLLIQLFFIYYALPAAGLSLKNMTAAYIGIGLCGGAYISEIIRGSIISVGSGQKEAAISFGLSRLQTYTLIILPQAARIAIPPLMNSFSAQLKETSLVSVLAINELTRMGQMVYSRTFRPFEIYCAVAVIYFILTYSASRFSKWLEKYFSYPS